MSIITKATLVNLESAAYSQAYTEIHNDHRIFSQDDLDLMTEAAQAVGISLADTGFTVSVRKAEQGTFINQPRVFAKLGQAVLKWGNLSIPVHQLASATVDLEDERFYLSVGSVTFALAVPKTNTLKLADFRKLLKAGTLGSALSEEFVPTTKLRDVVPGTYTVVGFESYLIQGDIKFKLLCADGTFIGCNTALAKRLDGLDKSAISLTSPAILTVMESTSKTSQGHAIIPVRLELSNIGGFEF